MSSGPIVTRTDAMPLLWGTVGFFAAGTFFALISFCMGAAGKNKYMKLSIPLIYTATVCLWLPWVCAWLMQWHPLIMPELKDE